MGNSRKANATVAITTRKKIKVLELEMEKKSIKYHGNDIFNVNNR